MTGITGIIAFIELVWIAMTSLKMLTNVNIKSYIDAKMLGNVGIKSYIDAKKWNLLPEKTWTKNQLKLLFFAMIVKLKLLFYTGAKSLLYQVIHWFSRRNNTQF